MLRILAGKVRRSLSIWQTTHRNLRVHVSTHHEPSDRITYMPSAFSDSTSMTSCLSPSLHFRILRSEWTTDLMYSIISSFCPLSLWREIWRDVKGLSTLRTSTSGRLVTHRCIFGRFNSIRSSTSSRTFSRADGVPEILGHSSRASIMIHQEKPPTLVRDKPR